MSALLAALVPALFPVLFPAMAVGASPLSHVLCEDTARMEQRLAQTLTSQRRATGLRAADQVVEVWTDAQGDWTMVMRYASGQSCIVAMGANWQDAMPPS